MEGTGNVFDIFNGGRGQTVVVKENELAATTVSFFSSRDHLPDGRRKRLQRMHRGTAMTVMPLLFFFRPCFKCFSFILFPAVISSVVLSFIFNCNGVGRDYSTVSTSILFLRLRYCPWLALTQKAFSTAVDPPRRALFGHVAEDDEEPQPACRRGKPNTAEHKF